MTKKRTIEIDEETEEFLRILAQQELSLPIMFKEHGWNRWGDEQLKRILKKIFDAIAESRGFNFSGL